MAENRLSNLLHCYGVNFEDVPGDILASLSESDVFFDGISDAFKLHQSTSFKRSKLHFEEEIFFNTADQIVIENIIIFWDILNQRIIRRIVGNRRILLNQFYSSSEEEELLPQVVPDDEPFEIANQEQPLAPLVPDELFDHEPVPVVPEVPLVNISMGENYTELFAEVRKYMEQEEKMTEELKSVVTQLDELSRDIIAILENVHKPTGLSQIFDICGKAREKYILVKELFAKLHEIVPSDEFYRYNDKWRCVSQTLVFSAAFIVFLEDGKLIDSDTAASFLGISANPEDSFHIDLDDFLLGLLLLADEMTRLSMNSAAYGNYKWSMQIAQFVFNMNAGFSQLNPKNDNLRDKFDSLKYNLKKVEEVVYDLSIRGLINTNSEEGPAS